jgi:hypothetical protein
MACTSTTNPAQISVKAGTNLHITCLSFAGFYQQVILSFNQNMSNPVGTFTGTGENKPMSASGQSVLKVPTGSNTNLYAKFNFSTNGAQGPFQAASVCAPVVLGNPPDPVFTTVTSEDSSDNDDNDSYLTIVQI